MRIPAACERDGASLLLAAMAALLVLSSLHKTLAYDELDNLAYGHRFLAKGPSAADGGPSGCPSSRSTRWAAWRGVPQGRRERDGDAAPPGPAAHDGVHPAAGPAWSTPGRGRPSGPRAGLAALALYVTTPTFLAHGKQVTSDVQTAVLHDARRLMLALRRRVRARDRGLRARPPRPAGWPSSPRVLLPVAALLRCRPAEPHAGARGGAAGLPGRRARPAQRRLPVRRHLPDGQRPTLAQPGLPAARGAVAVPIPLPRVFVLGLDYSQLPAGAPRGRRGARTTCWASSTVTAAGTRSRS